VNNYYLQPWFNPSIFIARRDIVMAIPSVCLSVTRRYCIDTNAHIVKLFLPSGKDITLVFFEGYLLPLQNSNGNSLSGGIKYKFGGKICDF